jgi:hypothetical protein
MPSSVFSTLPICPFFTPSTRLLAANSATLGGRSDVRSAVGYARMANSTPRKPCFPQLSAPTTWRSITFESAQNPSGHTVSARRRGPFAS